MFLRLDSTNPEKLRHHRSGGSLSTPGCRFSLRVFPISTFGSQEVRSSRASWALFSLHPLDESSGLALFCLLARGHLNGAPAPLKKPPRPSLLNPLHGDTGKPGRGKTRCSHAQFYGKSGQGLPKRRKELRERKRVLTSLPSRREKKKKINGGRKLIMIYLMIFVCSQQTREKAKEKYA